MPLVVTCDITELEPESSVPECVTDLDVDAQVGHLLQFTSNIRILPLATSNTVLLAPVPQSSEFQYILF